jgi:hypothetical protein
MGLYKRFYLGSSGIYLTGGGDLVLQGMSAKLKGYSDYSLSISSLSIHGGLKLGYNISPNLEITGSLGYTYPLTSSAKISDNNGNEVWKFDTADVSGGINIFVRVQWHIPTVGPFVKFYRKPSTICEKIRQQHEAKKAVKKH